VGGGRWSGFVGSPARGSRPGRSKQDPVEAAIAIIKAGDAGIASFNMDERDVERFMAQTWVVTGSDGSTGHPRKYGTFPRKIGHYGLARGVITLARAIESSSLQTARIVGLSDRGGLAPGMFADVIVFDSTRFADRSTYEQPELLATGIRFVFVNGRGAVVDGRPTGILAGRPLVREAR
jgi:N-acyl-D-aspartate/D-glutamate deacylase